MGYRIAQGRQEMRRADMAGCAYELEEMADRKYQLACDLLRRAVLGGRTADGGEAHYSECIADYARTVCAAYKRLEFARERAQRLWDFGDKGIVPAKDIFAG